MPVDKRILSIAVVYETDNYPDLSWIGEYSCVPGPANRTIDREARGECSRGECRYFIAANSPTDTGNPISIKQDYARMESISRGDVGFIGISACAEVQTSDAGVIQRITSGGLWGIASDSVPEHFAEVEREELSQLRDELLSIGFSADQVAAIPVSRKDGV